MEPFILLAVVVWILHGILKSSKDENEAPTLIRGRRLLFDEELKEESNRAVTRGETFPLGGVEHSINALKSHALILGTTGSGKTLTMQMIANKVLPTIKKGSDRRAFILDGKMDALGQTLSMDVHCPVILLNPLDIRACAWDMAADCNSLATALQIGAVFIPEDSGQNRYFTDAARDLFTGNIEALMLRAPGRWTLRDLIIASRSREIMEDLLSRCPTTRDRAAYFQDEKTFSSIHTTLTSRLAPFGVVAACWDRAPYRISLNDWARSESILIYGSDETTRFAMDAILRVVYQRKSEILLGQTESATRLSVDFLDEVREAGKLTGLSRLLTKGRSKGAAVLLGMQDIDGFSSVHGTRVANEILGQCSLKVFLRLENERIAEWCSKLFGDQEWEEKRFSTTDSSSGKSKTWHRERVVRRLVIASQFLNLPFTNPRNGLTGYYLSPFVGAYLVKQTSQEIDSRSPQTPSSTPSFLPRPSHHQILRPWTGDDRRRLNLL